ncbi:MAG: ABC transporter permease [Clostridia bacterium]|nr:ABC transporter permease [Clostridia bacterium]
MIAILVDAISVGTIFLFGCIGEILTEKAGNLNLGIPGTMCIGALGGSVGVKICINSVSDPSQMNGFVLILVSIIFAMIFAGFAGLIYAFLTVSLKANQNVTGLAMTTFGVGFMKFFAKRVHDPETFKVASDYFKHLFTLSENPGWFERIFLSHGVLVYLAIAMAILATLLLNKTRTGLHLRAVGENPATADAAGINISKYKYGFIVLGSAIAGLGGLYYVMDKTNGSTLAEAAIDSFGWLAVALVIATMWKPVVAIFGSIIFGGLSTLAVNLTGLSFSQLKIFDMFPYIITVLVLILTSIFGKKEIQPPASLGQSYFREER